MTRSAKLDLEPILESLVDGRDKGLPAHAGPMRLRDVGGKGWSVLGEDAPLPLAVLKRAALEHNSRWMRAYVRAVGVELCPHGKTTMAPQLFDRQIADGAWGLTCATPAHLEVYRACGVRRVIFANQIAGRANVEAVLRHLRDPAFELYCLVDSIEGARGLAAGAERLGLERPVSVLLEVGAAGARTGVRGLADARSLADFVGASPALVLAGVETYEGVFTAADPAEREAQVAALIAHTARVAEAIAPRGGQAPFLLTAGGSEYFDLVVEGLAGIRLAVETQVVLRSGCYLTHDNHHYERGFSRLMARRPELASLGAGLTPALEVWAYVQSRPEPTRAYCSLGKRDLSYDWDLPQPTLRFRPGVDAAPSPIGAEHRTVVLNDQHAHLQLPAASDLQVGDMVAFGISHPCTTFDKWRVIPIVDEAYVIVDAVRTYF